MIGGQDDVPGLQKRPGEGTGTRREVEHAKRSRAEQPADGCTRVGGAGAVVGVGHGVEGPAVLYALSVVHRC